MLLTNAGVSRIMTTPVSPTKPHDLRRAVKMLVPSRTTTARGVSGNHTVAVIPKSKDEATLSVIDDDGLINVANQSVTPIKANWNERCP